MDAQEKSGYMVFNRKLLKMLGVSLEETEELWYKVYSWLLICFMWSYPASVLHAILTNSYDTDVLLENTALIFATINASFTTFAIFCVRKHLGRLILLLEVGIFAPNTERGGEEEVKLVDECTFYVNTQLMVMNALAIGNVTCSVTATLVTRIWYKDPQKWILPYGKFAVFDVTYSPNFEAAVLYQVLSINLLCFALLAVLTLTAGLLAYVSYQCKMLQNFIKKSIEYSMKKMCLNEEASSKDLEPATIEWKYLKQTIKEIVEYHSSIISLADELEEALNVSVLIYYLGVSTVICLALFSASTFTAFNLHLVNQLILTSGSVFTQFIIAYWSNEVITESEEMSRACYEVDSMDVDKRFQKCLMIITERSQNPIVFTVGKFAPLSVNTFQKVMQTAYSYFMMLRNFRQN